MPTRPLEDRTVHKYDYRYWAERENFFLREFLKRQNEFTHVVQARHLISENEAAKQVLTRDAGITIADWLRVKPRYADLQRLAVASEAGRAAAFLFRPLAAANESSPACLRIALQPAARELHVRIVKRRGSPLARPLRLALDRPFHVVGRAALPRIAGGDARADRRLGLPVHA